MFPNKPKQQTCVNLSQLSDSHKIQYICIDTSNITA